MPPWVLGTLAVGGGLLAILMMSRAGEKGACSRYRLQYRSAASRGDIEDVEILESKAREAGCDWVGG